MILTITIIYIIGFIITLGVLLGIDESGLNTYNPDFDDAIDNLIRGIFWPLICLYFIVWFPIYYIGEITYNFIKKNNENK